MLKTAMLILMGMVVGAGLFATGVAAGTAYATRAQGECDAPDEAPTRVRHHEDRL